MKSSGPTRNESGLRNRTRKLWYRLLLFGFYLLYNQLAWTYDLVSWVVSLGQWREWQRAGIGLLSGKRILELAHGPGHLLLELDRDGYEVTGLDLSPYMIRMAGRRLQRARIAVPLVRGKAQSLPFKTASFDSILATFPAPFIVTPSTIASMFRVLSPGGRVVIVPEARLRGGGPLRRFLEWLFAITGQRLSPADDSWVSQLWLEPENNFLVAGFRVTLNHIPLDSSEVTVIIAEKP